MLFLSRDVLVKMSESMNPEQRPAVPESRSGLEKASNVPDWADGSHDTSCLQ